MQLQFSQLLLSLTSIYEHSSRESIKILLEVPVIIARLQSKRIIDIVIQHIENGYQRNYPIELKCFRKLTRDGQGNRGAQNLGMYDYWLDIENIEQYSLLENYSFGTQLTITDDNYYVTGRHQGQQTSVYSTNNTRLNVAGLLQKPIANRPGTIELIGTYNTTGWEQIGDFNFIKQHNSNFEYD